MELSPSKRRRHENIRYLLRTLNDIYPGPSALKTAATSGPAPGTRVPCDFCHRSGKAYDPSLKEVRACPVCDGAKWRKRRKGEPEWDEYLETTVATAETRRPEPMSPARLDAELQRVELDLRLRGGELDPNEAYGWERERERRDKGASYPELERALGLMQIELPLGRSFLNWYYLSGLDISTTSVAVEAQLIGWLSDRMRGKVRVPRKVYEAQQEELRKQARWLLREGLTELEAAKHLGVSRAFVRKSSSTESAGTLQVSLRGPDSGPGELSEPPHALERG